MAMVPERKALLVAALKSGDYPQTTGYLRTPDGFCCLGVACEIAVLNGVIDPATQRPDGIYSYGPDFGEVFALPPVVQEWFGFADTLPDSGLPAEPLTEDEIEDGDTSHPPTLAELNDSRKMSFTEIADVIDQHL